MKGKGTFIVKWKADGDSSAETHVDGLDRMPDQIKAMVASTLLESLADNPSLILRVDIRP